jgi:hypothetical protein
LPRKADTTGAESASERLKEVLRSLGSRKWFNVNGAGGDVGWVPVSVVEDGSAGCGSIGAPFAVLKDWVNGVGIPRIGSPNAFDRSVRRT